MERPKIIVVGSSNTDMVVKSNRLPAPGETVLGGEFLMNPGGKGANQAVAAARMGGEVYFIGRVGEDVFGKEAIEGLRQEGIHTNFIRTDEHRASGVALILVNAEGENSISVAPGANAGLNFKDIDAALPHWDGASFLLMQLEVPMEVVVYAAQKAGALGIPVVLNPAPAQSLSDELLEYLYMLTPNETECQLLTGIEVIDEGTAAEGANALHAKGIDVVIITLGAMGAFISNGNLQKLIPPPPVEPIDTTAAGDTFNGALVVALGKGMDLEAAVNFANKAAAVSTTRLGAQASIPFLQELMGS